MNINRQCLSREFLLSLRDSVIQTQYLSGEILNGCHSVLPARCLRPINFSALTPRNRFFRANATSEDCKLCPVGTYMSEDNRELRCHDCTTCSLWPVTIIECNATNDRVCGCPDGYDKSIDGCVKKTADPNPLSNCTASVERIELFLKGLQKSLNVTHGDTISEISRELKKLNQTLADGLDHIEKCITRESTLVSAMNHTHETITGTHEDGCTTQGLLIATLVIVGIHMISALAWEWKKRKLHISKNVAQIKKELCGSAEGRAPANDDETPLLNFVDGDLPEFAGLTERLKCLSRVLLNPGGKIAELKTSQEAILAAVTGIETNTEELKTAQEAILAAVNGIERNPEGQSQLSEALSKAVRKIAEPKTTNEAILTAVAGIERNPEGVTDLEEMQKALLGSEQIADDLGLS